MRAIRIYEPNAGGHHLEYVAQVARECAERGYQAILLTSRDGEQSTSFAANIGSPGMNVVVELVQKRTVGSRGGWRAAIRGASDPLIVLDADRRPFLIALATLFRWPRRGARVLALVMRPPWGRSTPTSVLKGWLWTSLSRLPALDVVALGDCFGELSLAVPAHVSVIADKPILYSARAAGSVEMNAPRTILLGGVVNDRKAPLALCRGTLEWTALDVHVAGVVDPSIRPDLESMAAQFPGRLTLNDTHLSNRDLDTAVVDADIVSVLLRTDIGSSGMLGRAVAYGKPVVAGGNQTVVSTVAKRGLGAVASSLDANSVGIALREICDHWQRLRTSVERASSELDGFPSLGQQIVARIVRAADKRIEGGVD